MGCGNSRSKECRRWQTHEGNAVIQPDFVAVFHMSSKRDFVLSALHGVIGGGQRFRNSGNMRIFCGNFASHQVQDAALA